MDPVLRVRTMVQCWRFLNEWLRIVVLLAQLTTQRKINFHYRGMRWGGKQKGREAKPHRQKIRKTSFALKGNHKSMNNSKLFKESKALSFSISIYIIRVAIRSVGGNHKELQNR